jgi:hypothetical protein
MFFKIFIPFTFLCIALKINVITIFMSWKGNVIMKSMKYYGETTSYRTTLNRMALNSMTLGRMSITKLHRSVSALIIDI